MSSYVSSSVTLWTGGAAVGAFVLHVYLTHSRNVQTVNNTPGLRTIISIFRPTMALFPAGKIPYSNWFFSIGPNYLASKNYETFRLHGQDIISGVSLDFLPPNILIADAEAAQEVLGNRSCFRKPIETYVVLNLYGPNILTTEYEDWRIHRKIASPGFSEDNNRLVCEETIITLQGLFNTWKGNSVIQCDVTKVTKPLALMVICGAGFGKRVSWIDTQPPLGHQLTFKETIEIVSNDIFIKVAVPDFAMNLTARTSRVKLGFAELKNYIYKMIQERSKDNQDHSDLLSNLIAANEYDEEGRRLTDNELVGDIFIFLIAGHETTAHTLAFALGLLALYPEIQERLYRHLVEGIADSSGVPTYSEVATLTYATAVFNETLRLFPPVTIIPKRSTESSILRTVNSKEEPVVIPVPKDFSVNVIVPALHRNPRYWKDPDEFLPERFLGDWPKHAFVPFSLGGRSCIGRRFAEVEGIVALSMLIRNYRIEIQSDQLVAGESLEERRARILAFDYILTLTPKHIPVTLSRR